LNASATKTESQEKRDKGEQKTGKKSEQSRCAVSLNQRKMKSAATAATAPTAATATPYDRLVSSAEEKEERTGWTKLQVAGFPPAAFYAEYNRGQDQKMIDCMNRNNAKTNKRNQMARMLKGGSDAVSRLTGMAAPEVGLCLYVYMSICLYVYML
jgi:hypothetical protein